MLQSSEAGKFTLKLALVDLGSVVTGAIDNFQPYAKTLGAKLQLTQKVLGHLMPHAMKGDYERYLADASIFMEFFSLIIMSWTWLDLGVHATKAAKSNGTYSKEFYESKIHTMKFYFKYELPKTLSLAETLMSDEVLTIKEDTEYIV